ncbi:hypothetical protein HYV82_03680 [Candidatus Woesearchaeota archaeon]|nr:hypothetical protein [Candidatus Woesearchaeota archaeon]
MATTYEEDLNLKAAKIERIEFVLRVADSFIQELESKIALMRTNEEEAKKDGSKYFESAFFDISRILYGILKDLTDIVSSLTPFYKSVSERLGHPGSLEARSPGFVISALRSVRHIMNLINELEPYVTRILSGSPMMRSLHDSLKGFQYNMFSSLDTYLKSIGIDPRSVT